MWAKQLEGGVKGGTYINKIRTWQKKGKFHEHILASDHNGLLVDARVVLIDKTNPITHTIQEEFWINALRTKQTSPRF